MHMRLRHVAPRRPRNSTAWLVSLVMSGNGRRLMMRSRAAQTTEQTHRHTEREQHTNKTKHLALGLCLLVRVRLPRPRVSALAARALRSPRAALRYRPRSRDVTLSL